MRTAGFGGPDYGSSSEQSVRHRTDKDLRKEQSSWAQPRERGCRHDDSAGPDKTAPQRWVSPYSHHAHAMQQLLSVSAKNRWRTRAARTPCSIEPLRRVESGQACRRCITVKESLRLLQLYARAALEACADSKEDFGDWSLAATEIDRAIACCSSDTSGDSLLAAQRHLRVAITGMYPAIGGGRAADQHEVFALARSAAIAAIFDVAYEIVAVPGASPALTGMSRKRQ